MSTRNPKTIATINFKGGVGKTTITWCLGDVTSSFSDTKVLLFDLDAQMSLTQAIALNEDTGALYDKFGKWYDSALKRKKTIFDALDQYTLPGPTFDFPVGFDFIYQITENLHFVPSVEDLYWMELGVFDRDGVKDFVRRLLGKIVNSRSLPQYDYVLFDCPPSFTLLSYSVLASCDLILIPVNPDFFAAKGTNLILNSLRMRIEPFPLPKIGVFMNRARTYAGKPTKEAQFYLSQVERACEESCKTQQAQAKVGFPTGRAYGAPLRTVGCPKISSLPSKVSGKKLWSTYHERSLGLSQPKPGTPTPDEANRRDEVGSSGDEH